MIKGELDMGKMYKMFLLSAAVCIVLNGCAGGSAAETERNGSVEGLGDVTYSENEVADSPIVFEGYDMDGNAVSNEYDDETFQIIGVVSNVQEGTDQETMNLLADLIEKTEADYTHLLVNESIYYALLTDVAAVPTTFFVNADGVILDTVVGSMDKSAWEEKINELLEGL